MKRTDRCAMKYQQSAPIFINVVQYLLDFRPFSVCMKLIYCTEPGISTHRGINKKSYPALRICNPGFLKQKTPAVSPYKGEEIHQNLDKVKSLMFNPVLDHFYIRTIAVEFLIRNSIKCGTLQKQKLLIINCVSVQTSIS